MIWELVKERIYIAALGELDIYVVEVAKKCEGVFLGIGQLNQTRKHIKPGEIQHRYRVTHLAVTGCHEEL